jgi:hypothetical protein
MYILLHVSCRYADSAKNCRKVLPGANAKKKTIHRYALWDFLDAEQKLQDLCRFETLSDSSFGPVKMFSDGNVCCVWALLFHHRDQPQVTSTGTEKLQSLQVYLCSSKWTIGFFDRCNGNIGPADLQDVGYDSPNMFNSNLTPKFYFNWCEVHRVLIKGWMMFQLLRAKLNQVNRQRVITFWQLNKTLISNRYKDAKKSLTDLSRAAGGNKKGIRTPNYHFEDMENLWTVVCQHDSTVLFSVEAPFSHFVACDLCNRFPIIGRAFVCNECKGFVACKDCYHFHNPLHEFQVVGRNPAMFPDPEADGKEREEKDDGDNVEVEHVPIDAAAAVSGNVPDQSEGPAANNNQPDPPAPSDRAEGATDNPDSEEVYEIEKIVKSRYVSGQQQFYIKYVGLETYWVSRQQLLCTTDIAGEFGYWIHKHPYDTREYMTAALDAIPVTSRMSTTNSTRSRCRSRTRSRSAKKESVPVPKVWKRGSLGRHAPKRCKSSSSGSTTDTSNENRLEGQSETHSSEDSIYEDSNSSSDVEIRRHTINLELQSKPPADTQQHSNVQQLPPSSPSIGPGEGV